MAAAAAPPAEAKAEPPTVSWAVPPTVRGLRADSKETQIFRHRLPSVVDITPAARRQWTWHLQLFLEPPQAWTDECPHAVEP